MIFVSKKAYTLVELLIVIAILGLMLAVGVPAFQTYGQQADFKQKAEEVAILLDQVNNYSKNPERDATAYWAVSDSMDNSISVYSCFRSDKCINSSGDGGDSTLMTSVKKVSMGKNQVLQSSTSLVCRTSQDGGCNLYPTDGSITIRDNKIGKMALYSISVGGSNFFKVKYTFQDSE